MSSTTTKHNNRVRYLNTLHGFQYLGNDHDAGTRGYVACMYLQGKRHGIAVNDYDHSDDLSPVDLHKALLKRMGLWNGDEEYPPRDVVWVDNYIGREYVAVHDPCDAPEVINAMLLMGIRVAPWTRLTPNYEPADAPFSIETSERLALRDIKELLLQIPSMLNNGSVWHPYLTLDERLWKTEEGKQFAREILAKYPELRTKHEIGDPLYLPKTTRPYDPRIDWPSTP